MAKKQLLAYVFLILMSEICLAQSGRVRDFGITIGIYQPGEHNSITDVQGVAVGHSTIIEGNDIRTGVTAIIPHQQNIFQNKVPAAVYVANGFGKLTGYTQIKELGNLETPIILTNTLSIPTAADALIDYTLSFEENKSVRSVNPLVGETNDGFLNDIQGRHVAKSHILEAIKNVSGGLVNEGSVGAGTGTICFDYKGGIGTASRKLPIEKGGFIIGVLVQTNFGGDLTIAGIPVGRELKKSAAENSVDGSCMIIVATDAPLTSRNLERLAKRSVFGIAKTGGICSNGSGEYVIAFSTNESLRILNYGGTDFYSGGEELRNDRMTHLFEAVIEATEEAILNSLFMANTITGKNGNSVKALPIDQVINILKHHKVIE